MRAIGYQRPLPIGDPDSLLDIDLPAPMPAGRDLLVEVRAVSVNPVDTKVRKTGAPAEGEQYKILGWDAAGVVKAVGPECTLFRPGDEVFYAGSLLRSGTCAELHLVDERIVGHKPASLGFAEAAALPLTSITAWELLFDRLGVARGGGEGEAILIVGGAGGVGSILIQLARQLTKLTVIATASRHATSDWCLELGAHYVIDHTQPFAPQMQRIGHAEVGYIACLTATDKHYPAVIEVLRPQGKIGVIDDPPTLDAKPLKRKAASLHWELMFTRSIFQTPDMIEQHRLLDEVSRLIGEGVLRSTHADTLGIINAANLKKAHALIESGKAKGKLVLEGF
ncbi:zinc-binding alcohol dehydrogenase family protein [Granulicella rosea]|uniref:Zinc-type alcohol dehydrogenase-like protein n=1 Tax=Granulicella rosea TaxID=474952 RepID=A0A239CZH5_9BACT|nr:zinc-binding alcohol dehydrogenase family protein [Granulicella rosea]SNS25457.1 zinc-binding alcohol dehydrogenase family protein [Granulicella rosea]